jgi:hypothetical protein
VLEAVGEDIAAFEAVHGPLSKAVPLRFAHLEYGRLYDMIAGPRGAVSSLGPTDSRPKLVSPRPRLVSPGLEPSPVSCRPDSSRPDLM